MADHPRVDRTEWLRPFFNPQALSVYASHSPQSSPWYEDERSELVTEYVEAAHVYVVEKLRMLGVAEKFMTISSAIGFHVLSVPELGLMITMIGEVHSWKVNHDDRNLTAMEYMRRYVASASPASKLMIINESNPYDGGGPPERKANLLNWTSQLISSNARHTLPSETRIMIGARVIGVDDHHKHGTDHNLLLHLVYVQQRARHSFIYTPVTGASEQLHTLDYDMIDQQIALFTYIFTADDCLVMRELTNDLFNLDESICTHAYYKRALAKVGVTGAYPIMRYADDGRNITFFTEYQVKTLFEFLRITRYREEIRSFALKLLRSNVCRRCKSYNKRLSLHSLTRTVFTESEMANMVACFTTASYGYMNFLIHDVRVLAILTGWKNHPAMSHLSIHDVILTHGELHSSPILGFFLGRRGARRFPAAELVVKSLVGVCRSNVPFDCISKMLSHSIDEASPKNYALIKHTKI